MKIMDKIWLLAAMFAFSACSSDETIVGQEEPEKELKEYAIPMARFYVLETLNGLNH